MVKDDSSEHVTFFFPSPHLCRRVDVAAVYMQKPPISIFFEFLFFCQLSPYALVMNCLYHHLYALTVENRAGHRLKKLIELITGFVINESQLIAI